MAAALRSSSAVDAGTYTNRTITAPSGITNGDLLLIAFAMNSSTSTYGTATPPAGFSAVTGFPVERDNGSNNYTRLYLWKKTASGESGNYQMTHSSWSNCGYMMCFSDPGTMSNPTIINSGYGTTVDFTGITTSAANALVVALAMQLGYWADADPAPAGTTPTFTKRFGNAAEFNWIYMADGSLASAGATGDKTVTRGSSGYYSAYLFELSTGVTNTNYSPAVGTGVYAGQAPLINPQFARPISDASAGSWTPSSGGDLYAMLDEDVADSADYIQSAANPSGDTVTLKLATITDPGSDTGFQLETLAGATGSTGQVVVSLRQGNAPGTEIAAWTHAGLPVGGYMRFRDGVSAAQAGNITDFADLYVRFVAS